VTWFASAGPRLRSAAGPLAFAVALAAANAAAAKVDGPRVERVATLDLPEEASTANDVRWHEDDALLLGVGGHGVYTWRVGAEHVELVATLAGSSRATYGLQNYSRVGGASSGSVAFSSSAYGVYRWDDSGIRSLKDIEMVGDLDRRHGMTVAVGLSRNLDGSSDPDDRAQIWEDRLAWLIFDDGTVRGLLPRRAAETSESVLVSSLGVARVLSQRQVLVVPGLEPDVFVYDRTGRLEGVFETETFFADSPWQIGPDLKYLLAERAYFEAWLSRHRVIDEVVADAAGNVYFFVRRVQAVLPYPRYLKPGPRVTGGFTVIGPSGELTPVPLSDRQVAEMLELVRASGHDIQSGEPIAVDNESLKGALSRVVSTPDPDSTRPPHATRVCWDLVHAHVDDLRAATRSDCVIEAELADIRLRADIYGGRAVILLRGATYGAVGQVRRSEAFEARLLPPGN